MMKNWNFALPRLESWMEKFEVMIHNSRIIDIIYRNQVSSYCEARLGQAGLVDSFWNLRAKCRATHYYFRGLIREAYIIQSLLKPLLIAQTPAGAYHEIRFFPAVTPAASLQIFTVIVF